MDKRQFLTSAAVLGAGAAAAPAFGQKNVRKETCAASPVLLTITGAIKRTNRGPFDPAFDQLLGKQQVKFQAGYVFDFPSITALPSTTINPTTEYDARQHALSGPLLSDVLEHVGAPGAGGTKILLRAIDGYAVMPTLDNVRAYRFIVATHLDGKPLSLGGLGPLWAVYDADHIPELAAKPLKDRFVLCPWALYEIQVSEA
jgi:hypothetical protein